MGMRKRWLMRGRGRVALLLTAALLAGNGVALPATAPADTVRSTTPGPGQGPVALAVRRACHQGRSREGA